MLHLLAVLRSCGVDVPSPAPFPLDVVPLVVAVTGDGVSSGRWVRDLAAAFTTPRSMLYVCTPVIYVIYI